MVRTLIAFVAGVLAVPVVTALWSMAEGALAFRRMADDHVLVVPGMVLAGLYSGWVAFKAALSIPWAVHGKMSGLGR